MEYYALNLSQGFAETVAAEIWRKKVNRKHTRHLSGQIGQSEAGCRVLVELGLELRISAIEADGPPNEGWNRPQRSPAILVRGAFHFGTSSDG